MLGGGGGGGIASSSTLYNQHLDSDNRLC